VQVPVVQLAWCDFRGSLARTEAERRYKYDGSPQANPPVTPAAATAAGPDDQGGPACMSEVREQCDGAINTAAAAAAVRGCGSGGASTARASAHVS
jgi:hypothetical protein